MAVLVTFTLIIVLSFFSGSKAACICPESDWLSLDGVGCFRYIALPKTFTEASQYCRGFSPSPDKIVNLASVHSEEEYNALRSMVPPPTDGWNPQVFIGLHLKDGVTPAWTDGSFYDYQNWCLSDPNAHPEGHGAISGGVYCNGLWVDVPPAANDQFHFICKSPCF